MDGFVRDLRHALRGLRRSPGFTLVAVISLAVGIGVNTAVFSLVDAVLFRPLPGVRDSGQLVSLFSDRVATPTPDYGSLSYPDYLDYQSLEIFEDLMAFMRWSFMVSGGETTERIVGDFVTGGYFGVLGTRAAVGRTLQPADARPGAPPAASITHRLWQRRFGGQPNVIGQTIRLDDQPFTIVGVLEPGFRGTLLDWLGGQPDVVVPFVHAAPFMPAGRDLLATRALRVLMSVGRLRPAIELDYARSVLTTQASRLAAQYPDTNGTTDITVRPTSRSRFFPTRWSTTVRFLASLMGLCGLVLLLSCFNVATLLLVRATVRERDIAVRMAIGASRRRIALRGLVEVGVLLVIGTTLGLGIALAFPRLLAAYPSPGAGLPLWSVDLGIDARVLAFTAGVSILTGLAAGLVPVLASATRSPPAILSSSGTGRAGTRLGRARDLLVVGQVALAFVVLVATGLLARSVGNLAAIDTGYRSDGVLVSTLDLRMLATEEARMEFLNRLAERTQALPDVQTVAFADIMPLGGFRGTRPVSLPDTPPDAEPDPVLYNVVSSGFFKIVGVPILRGQTFADSGQDAVDAVVVNEAFASHFWPEQDPLGRRLRVGGEHRDRVVVGVARNARYVDVWEEQRRYMYLPMTGAGRTHLTMLAATPESPARFGERLRREVTLASRVVTTGGTSRLTDELRARYSDRRVATAAAVVLSVAALLLVSVGLFGLLAHVVSQRTRELGVRIALGARRSQIAGLVVWRGVGLAVGGILLGVIGAFATTRVLRSLLFDISPTDPATLTLVATGLLAIALLSAYLPARRATRVDPMVALRAE